MTDERSSEQHVEGFVRAATTPNERALAEELRRARAVIEAAHHVCVRWNQAEVGSPLAFAIDKLRVAVGKESRDPTPEGVVYLRPRTTSEHVDDFIANACRDGTGHTRAVAAELQRLRGACAAYAAKAQNTADPDVVTSVVDTAVAELHRALDEVERLRAREQELLESNNAYLARARNAEYQVSVSLTAQRTFERLAYDHEKRADELAEQIEKATPLAPPWHCPCGCSNIPAYKQACERCAKPKYEAILDAARRVVRRFLGDEEGRAGWAAFQKDVEALHEALKASCEDA